MIKFITEKFKKYLLPETEAHRWYLVIMMFILIMIITIYVIRHHGKFPSSDEWCLGLALAIPLYIYFSSKYKESKMEPKNPFTK